MTDEIKTTRKPDYTGDGVAVWNTKTENKDYKRVVLMDTIKVNVFPNSKKEKPEHPDYKGSGIALWVNKTEEKDYYGIRALGMKATAFPRKDKEEPKV